MAASLRAVRFSCLWMHSVATCKQVPLRTGAVCHTCHKSTYSVLPEDYNCKVDLALTSDSKTIVCYHPSLEIPYEHTKLEGVNRNVINIASLSVCPQGGGKKIFTLLFLQPVPRPDPVNNKEETLDQVLKSRLSEEELKNHKGLTFEKLSKMFYTTKHRWYPVGQ
ncbi:UNVERIFIED_CONTAM: hypothetical protein H355_002379 [Colinus virginianus]|nr:hypothetical protein H355_002379 [Colinus virginianus]